MIGKTPLTPALSPQAGRGSKPLSRTAGEGGAHRLSDGRVRGGA
jgi:hypothetical protein